ncbi:MAG TPA: sigma-70 family RNA polymerase sigma factor [Phycisphaerae bacterium]|nr:sigma-70 family RNA polymerase sigma factor [Phycisphaerae bacterium]
MRLRLKQTVRAQEVFEILMRENADMLTAYLRAVVRNPAAVDDLFQEAMLVAWRRLDDYDRTRPFGPWLRGIAARLVLAHQRSSRKDMLFCSEEVLAHLDRRLEQISRRPGDTWDQKVAALRDCLRRLPDGYRAAVELRYRGGLDAQSVADRLALSIEAARKRLQRARGRLADCLRGKGVFASLEPPG